MYKKRCKGFGFPKIKTNSFAFIKFLNSSVAQQFTLNDVALIWLQAYLKCCFWSGERVRWVDKTFYYAPFVLRENLV